MPIASITIGALFGLLFGSFANVVILRDGRRLSILTGHSECPNCKKPLKAFELVPVLSWLALGGRCRNCKKPISVQYPLVELTAAILVAGAVWFGFILHGSVVGAVLLAFSLLVALVISVIDIQTMEVPIDYVVVGGVLATAAALVLPTATPLQSLEGLVLGGGVLGLVMLLWKLVRHEEGMGSGDIWILAAIGAGLGPILTAVALVLAVWAGSIVGIAYALSTRRGLKLRMPFGPFLYAGGLAALLFGQRVADWYILTLR